MPATRQAAAKPRGGTTELQAQTVAAWQHWDPATIVHACERDQGGTSTQAGKADPHRAHWHGLASFMREGAEALSWLERAYLEFDASKAHHGAAVAAHAALVICLLDSGAMAGVDAWQQRADASLAACASSAVMFDPGVAPEDGAAALDSLWLQWGSLASVALGRPDTPVAARAALWLQAQLQPLGQRLNPHERLLTALVLIEYQFTLQRFEHLDLLANQVEGAPEFAAAAPMLRARWVHIHGFAHYQAGDLDRAERAWRRSLALAAEFGIASVQMQSSLALARLMLDRGRIDEAEQTVQSMQPQWGAGRTAQLIQWQQLRARVQLLRGQAVQALASMDDALRLADALALPPAEQATGLSIRIQALMALQRFSEALDLLARLADEQRGRDAQVSRTQLALLRAWTLRLIDRPESQRQLANGLALAQECRFTMFFRLLPDVAAGLCALALRWDVAPLFVLEVIRARALPAPMEADARWPWPVWLKLLGGFELHGLPATQSTGGKTPHKPIELLHLLACAGGLALRSDSAAQALWPQAETEAARKNLEMAGGLPPAALAGRRQPGVGEPGSRRLECRTGQLGRAAAAPAGARPGGPGHAGRVAKRWHGIGAACVRAQPRRALGRPARHALAGSRTPPQPPRHRARRERSGQPLQGRCARRRGPALAGGRTAHRALV